MRLRLDIGRSARDQRGSAVVELALVLPVLLFVLFGAVEFGRAFNYWIDANHIANEGARWAMVDRIPGNAAPNASQLRAYLYGQLDAASFPQNRNLKVCIAESGTGGSVQVGDPVEVTVSTPFSFPLIGQIAKFFGSPAYASVTISGKSTMRIENLPTIDYQSGGVGC